MRPFTSRQMVVGLVLSMWGCQQGVEPTEPEHTLEALGEATSCGGVQASTPAPGWLAAPVIVAGGVTAQLHITGAAAPALLVLQNGDGLGTGGVSSVKLLRNGVPLHTKAALPPLSVIPVSLVPGDVFSLTAKGGAGTVRLALASAAAPPCPVASVSLTRSTGKPQTLTRTFDRPDGATLGLVRVLVTPEDAGGDGVIMLNGQRIHPRDDGDEGDFAVVPLAATNALDFKLGGKPGRTVTVTIFDLDSTPPSVAFAQPADGALTNAATLAASGTSSADATAVSVGEAAANLASGAWTAQVPATEGANILVAEARDFCGNVSRACHAVEVDTRAPVITVTGVAALDLRNAPVTPQWSATDDHLAAISATLDGSPLAAGTSVGAEGDHLLVVSASDAAGNTSTVSVPFSIDLTPPEISISGVTDEEAGTQPVTLTFDATDLHLGSVSATVDGAPFASGDTVSAVGDHQLTVTANDLAQNIASRTVAFRIDAPPPPPPPPSACPLDAQISAELDAAQAAFAQAQPLGQAGILLLLPTLAQLGGDLTARDTACSSPMPDALAARLNAFIAALTAWVQALPPPCDPGSLASDEATLQAALGQVTALGFVGEPRAAGLLARGQQIAADYAQLQQACTSAALSDLSGRISQLTADVRSWLGSGPIGMTSTPPAFANSGDTVTYAPKLSIDATGFAFTLTAAPAGATVDAASGRISWQPTAGDKGPHAFNLVATRGTLVAQQVFTIAVSEKRVLQAVPIDANATSLTVTGTGTALDGTVIRVPEGSQNDLLIVSMIDPAPADSRIRFTGPALDVQLGSGRTSFDSPLELEFPAMGLAAGETQATFAWQGDTKVADLAGGGAAATAVGVWGVLDMGGGATTVGEPGTAATGASTALREATAGRFRIMTVECADDIGTVGSTLQRAENEFKAKGFALTGTVKVTVIALPTVDGNQILGVAANRRRMFVHCGQRDARQSNTIAHELFHLEQMQLKGLDQAIADGGGEWLIEATAEFMGQAFTGGFGGPRLDSPKSMVEETLTTTADLHAYDSFIYFDFLTTVYGFDMKSFWDSVSIVDVMVGEPEEAAARALRRFLGTTYYPEFVHAYNASREGNFSLLYAAESAPEYPTGPITEETAVSIGNGSVAFLSSRTYRISVDAPGSLMVRVTGSNVEASVYQGGSDTKMALLPAGPSEVDLGDRQGQQLWIHVVNSGLTPEDAPFDVSVRIKKPAPLPPPPPPPGTPPPPPPPSGPSCTVGAQYLISRTDSRNTDCDGVTAGAGQGFDTVQVYGQDVTCDGQVVLTGTRTITSICMPISWDDTYVNMPTAGIYVDGQPCAIALSNASQGMSADGLPYNSGSWTCFHP